MNKTSNLISRIEALNGLPLANLPTLEKSSGNDAAVSKRPNVVDRFAISLEQAVDGAEIEVTSHGKAFLIERRIDKLSPQHSELSAKYNKAFYHRKSGLFERLSPICDTNLLEPQEVLIMDIETTGLSGSPLFLVGTLVWENDELIVRQFFARDYSEETAVTSCFIEAVRDKRLLVTFNGKSFDLPYIRTRAAANGLTWIQEPAHFDLLHESRRVWRKRLPNCRLQTLEHHVCGVMRCDDIPGSEIPEAYNRFVRTSDAFEIARILEHNAYDLVTLADLMLRLPADEVDN